MKKKLLALSSIVLGAAPFAALAQNTGTFNSCAGISITTDTIEGILCKLGDLLNIIVPILITLAVIYFIWGVISYVIASDEEAKKAGRDRMIFGVIGLLVIVAVWGLVKILSNTFGIDRGSQPITFPTVPY